MWHHRHRANQCSQGWVMWKDLSFGWLEMAENGKAFVCRFATKADNGNPHSTVKGTVLTASTTERLTMVVVVVSLANLSNLCEAHCSSKTNKTVSLAPASLFAAAVFESDWDSNGVGGVGNCDTSTIQPHLNKLFTICKDVCLGIKLPPWWTTAKQEWVGRPVFWNLSLGVQNVRVYSNQWDQMEPEPLLHMCHHMMALCWSWLLQSMVLSVVLFSSNSRDGGCTSQQQQDQSSCFGFTVSVGSRPTLSQWSVSTSLFPLCGFFKSHVDWMMQSNDLTNKCRF